jgi:hypothetical protein
MKKPHCSAAIALVLVTFQSAQQTPGAPIQIWF